MKNNPGKKYLVYLYLLLGALAAFPPLVTDMYLPALPIMTMEFDTTPSAVQMSLAACILGLAAGQLIFGPLSDKWGRKPLLKSALILFILATVASIFSPTIDVLNICRFFQGLGGAGGVVLSRSVATDCYSGRELAKTLAVIGAINGIDSTGKRRAILRSNRLERNILHTSCNRIAPVHCFHSLQGISPARETIYRLHV